MRRVIRLLVLVGLSAGAAAAQDARNVPAAPRPEDSLPRSEAARARYPQPVLIGALTGRQLLENTPRQTVLGRVAGVSRDPAGNLRILVDRGGVLGLGTRRVAVPVQAVALLGPFLVLMDVDRVAFEALPKAGPEAAGLLPGGQTIHVGLTRN